MECKEFGYARVSSKGQHEDRQLEALKEYGINERDIIVDKESGKDTNRSGYLSLRNNMLRNGDTLVVKELDRLSRSKDDIKNELEYFKQKSIRVKILDIPTTMADYPKGQEWVLEMVNNILIEVLGSIAEEERIKIKRRQREGIEAAHKKGIEFGRPNIKKPENWDEVMCKVETSGLKVVDAMKKLGVKKTSYYKLKKIYLVK